MAVCVVPQFIPEELLAMMPPIIAEVTEAGSVQTFFPVAGGSVYLFANNPRLKENGAAII
jgi:hypothetical protein